VESTLIIILLFNVRRRKKTEKNLLDSRGRLLVLNNDLEESNRKLSVYVEEIDKKNEQLYELTHIDPLTGLDNRPSIFSIIDDIITNNTEPLHTALLFLDIDNFKNVNDTYGHDIGDQVIRVVGRKLKKLENEHTNVGRFGGDEFLILLCSQENTRMIIEFARKVLDIISEEIVVSSIRIYLTASVGIALFPKDCLDRITLVKKADTALYRAKELGRNRYAFYNEKLDEILADKISLQTAIKKAYKDKTFYLKYQPYIDIRTNRVAGVEALLRWKNDEFKNVSAFDLVRNIEEMGLMVKAGYEILRMACEFAKEINKSRSHKIKMSVNVSAISLMHKGFYGKTIKIIHDTGVDPSLICLEMTETVLIKSLDESSDILTRLMEQNISIALDDFGTGYSSLRYLRELPVNVLKIDKTFIDNIEHNKYDQTIFNSMINIAHHRDISVVAEGVENHHQVETLRKYECDVIQGYYFSRPLAPDKVIDFIDNFNGE
jgi:diguanylate cyclase (GGDEF)-like protein